MIDNVPESERIAVTEENFGELLLEALTTGLLPSRKATGVKRASTFATRRRPHARQMSNRHPMLRCGAREVVAVQIGPFAGGIRAGAQRER